MLVIRPPTWRIPLRLRCISAQLSTKIRPDYFPYGISNYEKIRKEGYFFKDTTRHLEIIERRGDALSLFRPARWGKSLFARMMESYYCALNNKTVYPDKFQLLFGDTYVGTNTTPKQGKYVVLFWCFTIDPSGDALDMRHRLYKKINASIQECQRKYRDLLGESIDIDDNAMSSFRTFAGAVERSNYPLYLIIDEFDRFANKLMFETPEEYRKMIADQNRDPKTSVILSVLETVKSVSREVNMKTYITGINPIATAEAGGYNVCENISHLDSIASIVGFEESDVVRGLSKIFPSDPGAVQKHLAEMKEWYEGYRMTPNGPLLYNPTLCLHYMQNLCERDSSFDFLDENVALSRGVLDLIGKNPTSNELLNGLVIGKQYPAELQETFRLRDLLTRIEKFSRGYLLSFMFHHGIVTFSNSGEMVIPNKLSRDQLLDRIRARLGERVIQNIEEFLDTSNDRLLRWIIQGVAMRIHGFSGDALNYDESSMKNVIGASFLAGCSRKIEFEKSSPKTQGRADMVIFNPNNDEVEFIFELGTVDIGELNLKKLSECASLTQDLKKSVEHIIKTNPIPRYWSPNEKQIVDDAVGMLPKEELLSLEYKQSYNEGFRTIKTLLKEKAQQVWDYGNDPGLVDEGHRANLKCRAIVGVGMQGVVIRPVDAKKSKPR